MHTSRTCGFLARNSPAFGGERVRQCGCVDKSTRFLKNLADVVGHVFVVVLIRREQLLVLLRDVVLFKHHIFNIVLVFCIIFQA